MVRVAAPTPHRRSGSYSPRRAPPRPALTYEEAVQEALCFGWIGSTADAIDDQTYRIWMAPRKLGGEWSVNKRRIERLIADGPMTARGLAVIEAAKADDSWSKLDASHALDVPKDLADALAGYADAERNFGAFPRSARRAILQWIDAAKKPEIRAKRIAETARLANQNVRATSRTHAADAGTSRAFLPWTASMLHYQVRGR